MSVSAIVVSYRTGPRLKECLHALVAANIVNEIVIVDNGNPPDMQSWLKAFADAGNKIMLITPDANMGFGRAVNLAAGAVRYDNLLVLNPDCVVRHDAIQALLGTIAGRRSPSLIGGRIFGVDGHNQRGPMRRELTLMRALSKVVGGSGIDMPLEPHPSEPVTVDVTSGAFFMIDRAGFATLGGFDEGYFLHVEDIDLCKRVREAGGDVVYQPKAGALHYGATSDVPNVTVERYKAAGFARYFRKFSSGPLRRVAAELVIPIVGSGLILRALVRSVSGGRPKPH
ncbi:MAG: glycosyltransferase family 2 protein [Pseudomonadota bacterium]